ncbi:MAG: serine/threonine-protein kinase [Planctomycetota bacterium]|nr:serine/threonine-protein kinase [Planctomycetota bacterium]
MKTDDALLVVAVLHFRDLSPEQARRIDELCDYFEHQLYVEGRPRMEGLLGGLSEPERSVLLRELLLLELEAWLVRDAVPDQDSYLRRFPGHQDLVREVFATVFPQPPTAPASVPPETTDADTWPKIPNYRILGVLGVGGMGKVYEAIHTKLGTRVALKVMRETQAHDLEAETRFEREMRVIGNLAHPNIVSARDAGTADGQHYLVMEYVEGLDLDGLLKRVGTLSVPDACEVVRCAALALEQAHHHKLVRRDIKPKNIVLGRCPPNLGEVQVKVVDFGLASLCGYASLRDPAIPYGRVAGTFPYMAPEQYWQQTSDIRSDLYSLGCTLYCLLLGRPPYSRPQFEDYQQVMEAHRSAPVPTLRNSRPDVSEFLEQCVLSLLAKAPQDRVQRPADLAESLRDLAQGHDLAALLDHAEAMPAPGDHHELLPTQPLAQAASAGQAAAPQDVGGSSAKSQLDDTVPWTAPHQAQEEFAKSAPQVPLATSPARPPAWRFRPWLQWPPRRRVLVQAAVIAVVLPSLAGLWLIRSLQPAPVDLLALLRPDLEKKTGGWRFDGRTLVSPDEPYARVRLPYTPPEQYRLEIVAQCATVGPLVAGLIWQGRQVPVALGATGVDSETQQKDGQRGKTNSAASEFGFTGGAPNTYTCIVRREGYLVAYENRVQLVHHRDELSSPIDERWLPRDARPGIFLGTHSSVYRFTKITLTPLRH